MTAPARPTTTPTWGTAIAAGDIATPSNSELSTGIVKVGSPAIPQKLPYQWFNWLLYWLCQCVNYLMAGSVVDGGDDLGNFTITPNLYKLTIDNFPADADIPNGVIVQWRAGQDDATGAGNDNTGTCKVSINGDTQRFILDSNGNALVGYDIVGSQFVTMRRSGTSWILVNYQTAAAPNYFCLTDAGAANAYALTTLFGFPSQDATGVQPVKKGTTVSFYPAHNNTTASTLAIRGGTARAIKTAAGAALSSGDIVANSLAVVIWDGTNWVLTNPN